MITNIIYKTVDSPVGYFMHNGNQYVYQMKVNYDSIGSNIDKLIDEVKNDSILQTLYIFKFNLSDEQIATLFADKNCPTCRQKLPNDFFKAEIDNYKANMINRITYIIK